MINRPRLVQIGFAAAAVGLFTASGLLQRPLDDLSVKYELVAPADVVGQRYPEERLLTMAPGGVRAMALEYLWIRSQDLKNAGQHHEAMALAALICRLQPRFAGVWGYHAWDLTWNISVQTHTPEERWMWVTAGMKMLRDQAIPMNPRELLLYKELAWIYFQKMHLTSDDMHRVYKARWAAEMQRLLAAPPLAVEQRGKPTADSTQVVIDAFEPIAAAPLDKDPRVQGRWLIQPDKLAAVLADPAVAQYAAALKAVGVEPGWSLLDAYNKYTTDDVVAATRVEPREWTDKADLRMAELINDPSAAAARGKLLAFTRAQILWNEYKLDPQWMLDIMKYYHVPLDWRLPVSHALYWSSYGVHVCQSTELADIDSLNTDRTLLNSLKDLTWVGRLVYRENLENPNTPDLVQWSDERYIDATRKEFERLIAATRSGAERQARPGEVKPDNPFDSGHMNYVINAIEMYYAMDRRDEARALLEYIKKYYNKNDAEWKLDLDGFVQARLRKDDAPSVDTARSLITGALIHAYLAQAYGGEGSAQRAQQMLQFAMNAWGAYHSNAVERTQLAKSFRYMQANVVGSLLIDPQSLGVRVDMVTRSGIYGALDDDLKVFLYDVLEARIKPQFDRMPLDAEGRRPDFYRYFPKPVGLEEYRARQRATTMPRGA